jgi:hypothetical protein
VYPACVLCGGESVGRFRAGETQCRLVCRRRRVGGVVQECCRRLCLTCTGIRERAELLWGKPARRGRVRGVVDEGTRLRCPSPDLRLLHGCLNYLGRGRWG